MNIDFRLDFLYYQEEVILDGEDPKMRELYPHIDKFRAYINSASLPELFKLICFSYKEKYGQDKYWFIKLLVRYSYKTEYIYPSNLNDEIDFYAPSTDIERDDIDQLIFKRFLYNSSELLKEMEFIFKTPQLYLELAQGIEEGLEGVSFTREDTLTEVFFTVTDSPIASIRVNANTFILVINQDKWIKYVG